MDTLLLHYSVEARNGRDVIGLHPILHRNDGRLVFLTTFPDLGDLSAMVQVSEAFLGTVQRAIRAMGPKVHLRSAAGFSGDLQRCGTDLARLLLPDELVRHWLAGDRIRHVTFCVDPRLNAIPFEWMWVHGEFLAFRFGTGRELLSSVSDASLPASTPGSLPFSARMLVIPPPEASSDDRRTITDQVVTFFAHWNQPSRSAAIKVDTVNLSGRFTERDVLDAFRTREVVTVYSHHHYDRVDPGQSGYQLAPGQIFSAQQLLDGCPPGQRRARLVLSLCCESGITQGWEREWPQGARLHGMVDAAKRIGIPHYIGTWVEIPALKTALVIQPFFDALAAGQSVGEALRRARLAMRENPRNSEDGGTVLGLALTLYGDPSVALVSRSGRRIAEVHAPLCEARTEAGCCGAAVAPSDPGYASRLCSDHHVAEGCAAGHPVTSGMPLDKCRKCENRVCPQCSGWGRRLCWEHYSFEGNEIFGDWRSLCADPHGRHPGVKRSITVGDSAFVAGAQVTLCRDCREAASTATTTPTRAPG